MKKQFLMLAVAFTLAMSLPIFAASSPRGATLYTFTGGEDGSYPVAPLIADAQGNLYGTTQTGGGGAICANGHGCGTVFELVAPSSPSGRWQEKILYAFSGGRDGSFPVGGLILDSAGNLYGTTQQGGDLSSQVCGNPSSGCGVVFELSPINNGVSWTETVLHAFEGAPDGQWPGTSLIFDNFGNLFGTTLVGGSNSNCINCGIVFELSPAAGGVWTESILYSFTDEVDGAFPTSSLVFDSFGNLYGTTVGTIYQLVPSSGGTWSLNTIDVFSGNTGVGASVVFGGLLFDRSGNLFVTTNYDGSVNSNGLAIELIPPQPGGTWTENTLRAFNGGSDAHPYGFVADSSGNLYGTTQGNAKNVCGEIFKLNSSSGWNRTVLHTFSDTRNAQGCSPSAPLAHGRWNALYGTTYQGGSKHCESSGCGTVFGFLP